MLALALAVLLLPLFAFLSLLLGSRKISEHKGPYLAISAISGSFILSWFILGKIITGKTLQFSFPWFTVGKSAIKGGIILDPLAAVMLLVVTTVALLVQIYSLGYMHGEKRLNWYYAALSLFSFAMLGIVVANNFLQMLFFWELVGLCSYFLIGFWFTREDAQRASKKAFLTTRFGDVGFLLAIVIIFATFGTFSMGEVFEKAPLINPNLLTLVALLLFAGAVGKSAQFPLHVWLPDAMAGPTPVSALIHAATMVAAGVYLVARTYPLFEAAPYALEVVAYLGVFTAFLAATMAMAQNDIKKILAFSTVSQLGYMMVGLGVGSLATGMFHLTTHASFKALLFLGAGSVIHALHTQDLREMGRIYPKMKVTATTMIIGGLALAGIPPLAGFWSKDEILAQAFHNGYKLIYYLALITAFCTAFYIFRLIFLTFFGEEEKEGHESPKVMTRPLIILSLLAIGVGLIGSPLFNYAYGHFLGETEVLKPDYSIMGFSVLAGFLGIALAFSLYYPLPRAAFEGSLFSRIAKRIIAERYWISEAYLNLLQIFTRSLALLAANKYWLDELYQLVIVRPAHYLAEGLRRFDLVVIDGTVNWVAKVTVGAAYSMGGFDLNLIDRVVNAFGKVATVFAYILGGFDLKVIDRLVGGAGKAGVGVSKALGGFEKEADKLVVGGTAWSQTRLSWLARGFDLGVIDGLVNGVSALLGGIGKRLRKVQTGYLQNYPLLMFLAILLLIFLIIFLGKR